MFHAFLDQLPSQQGKTIVITGTTSGLGFRAAQAVAHLNGHLVCLNRPSTRNDHALKMLQSDYPKAKIDAIDCDLLSFASVHEAARHVQTLCPNGISTLCHNAGIMAVPLIPSSDGFDIQMQVNHLSHFLLAHELFPLLKIACLNQSDVRIIQHSSILRLTPPHRLKPDLFDPLKPSNDLKQGWTNRIIQPWLRYGQTKLANCAFAAWLHHQFQSRNLGIRSILTHPGVTQTQLYSNRANFGLSSSQRLRMVQWVSMTDTVGSAALIRAICDPSLKSGDFIGFGRGLMSFSKRPVVFRFESFYDNPQTRQLLWQKSCQAIGQSFLIK